MGRARAELTAFSISAAEADLDRDRARYVERIESFRQVEAAREEDMLIASGIPMSRWPKHTAGYQSWQALVDQQEAERAAERRRLDEAVAEHERTWCWRDREVRSAEPWEGVSWWRRLLRRPATSAGR